MRRLYSLLLIIFLPLALAAQGVSISKVEYFFNTDPGFGQGTEIEVTSATTHTLIELLETSELPTTGFHNLYVRGRSDEGHWGPYETKVVYVGTNAGVDDVVEIAALEYFFNEDPGLGNGTGINVTHGTSVSLAQSIETDGLSTGFHNLYLRGVTLAGDWGPYETKVIYVNSETIVDGVVEISALEYFFNSDPGFGQGSLINITNGLDISISHELNTSGLSPGFQNLYIRGRMGLGSNGAWGPYETKVIYVSPETNNVVEIAELEYFIGADPGFGQGTVISTDQAVSVSLLQTITTENLDPGFHNLYLRGKSTAGLWGPYETKVLYVDANANEPILIDQVEFFVDTDPGVGQGQIITIEAAEAVDEVMEVITSSLAVGSHKVYMRARSTNNSWGPYEVADFTVFPEILSENFESGLPASNSTGTFTLSSGDWDLVNVSTEEGSVNGGNFAARILNQNGELITPVFSGTANVSFYYALPSNGEQHFKVLKSVNGGAFTEISAQSTSSTTYQQYTTQLNEGDATVRIKIQTDETTGSDQDLLIDDFTGASFEPVLVTSTYPGNQGTDVALDSTLAIVFDQPVLEGAGNFYIVRVSDSTLVQTIGAGSVSISGDSIYFSMSGVDYATSYGVIIDPGAVINTNDVGFAGIQNLQTWSFTTEDAPPASIAITSPNGGETWAVGSVQNITWSESGFDSEDNIVISYSINGIEGQLYEITTGVPTDFSGTYEWTVPDAVSASVFVKVENTTKAVSDISDAAFEIESAISQVSTLFENFNSSTGIPEPNYSGSATLNGFIWNYSGISEIENGGVNNTRALSMPSVHAVFVELPELSQPQYLSFDAKLVTGDQYFVEIYKIIDGGQPQYFEGVSINSLDFQTYTVEINESASNVALRIQHVVGLEAASAIIDNISVSDTAPINVSITLENPNGGESWQVGSTQAITWTATAIDLSDNIEILLSTNGGETYDAFLADGTFEDYIEGDGYLYQWLVPNNITSEAKIKIVNQTKSIEGISEGLFSIVAAPSISLTSPNGGESWLSGSVQTIRWNAANVLESDEIEILLSTNGGDTYDVTIQNGVFAGFVAGEEYAYEWIVSENVTDAARIKVVNLTKDVSDESADFNIANPTFVAGFSDGIPPGWTSTGATFEDDPALGYMGQGGAVLIQGAGGNFLQTPYMQGVTFFGFFFRSLSFENGISFEIRISTDGVNYQTIATIPAGGSPDFVADIDQEAYHYFSHTFDPAFEGYIMISSNEGSDDFLIDNFQADGDEGNPPISISVLSPNGGEAWEVGSEQEISWQAVSVNDGDDIRIEYSIDNGGNYATIVESTFGVLNGTYVWTVPDAASDQVLVRVTNLPESISDVSDAVFTISEPAGAFEITQATAELVAPNLLGNISLSAPGQVYAVVLFNSGTVASAAELKSLAQGGFSFFKVAQGEIEILQGNTDYSFEIPSLPCFNCISAGTEYNIYFVGEDAEGNFTEITAFLNIEATAPPAIEFLNPGGELAYIGDPLEIRIAPVSIDPTEELIFELSTNGGATFPYSIQTVALNGMDNDAEQYFFDFIPNNNAFVSQSAVVRVKYLNEVMAVSDPFVIATPGLTNLSVAFPEPNQLYFGQATTLSFVNEGLLSVDLYRVVPGVGQVLMEENINLVGQTEVNYGITPDFVANNVRFRLISGERVFETGYFNVSYPVIANPTSLNFGIVTEPSTLVKSYSLKLANTGATITATSPLFLVAENVGGPFLSELTIGENGIQQKTIYVQFAPEENNGLVTSAEIINTFSSGMDEIDVVVAVQGQAASTDPSIAVLSPEAGLEAISNSILTIHWSVASVPNLKIEYSLDGGTNWNLIEENLPPANATFDWLVPEVEASTPIMMRFSDQLGLAPQQSVIFDLLPAPRITNLELNGGKTELTITGTGFSSNANDNEVIFPGFPDISAYPISASPSELIVEVPSGAVSGFIQVNVAGKGTAISLDQIILDGITISPDRGQVGQVVYINGSGVNFFAATEIEVLFTNGNLGAVSSTVTVEAADILAIVVPEGVVATGTVTVVLDGVEYATANSFQVQSFDFSPKTAGIFETVTITGENTKFLNNGTQVFVNGVQANISVINDTQINVTVPQGVVSGRIAIATNDGFYESQEDLNIELHTITSISSTKAGRGTQVIVQGTRFSNISNGGVKVNGVQIFSGSYVINYGANTITLTVPSAASGTGKITVTQGGVEVESPEDFTVIPRITSISMSQAAPGALVTLTGSYFSSTNNTVYFNENKPAAVLSQNPSSITVTVPNGAINGNIRVVNNDVGEEGVSATSIDIVPVHTFTGISPLKATVGQTVTLTGTNLSSPNPSQVRVNGTNVGFNPVNNSSLTFTVPNIHGAGKVQITRAGVTLISEDNFTILPKIDSWTLASGAVVGATVTISGAGFNPTHTNNEVRFANNTIATTTSGNSNSLTFIVPEGAATGKIFVTNKIVSETAESATDFVVVPQSLITSFSPENGQVNKTVVTISGQHFQNPNPTNVRFSGTNAAFTVNSDTEITATVPNITTSGQISIVRAGGTTTSGETFFLAPDITSISATTLASGASLRISGTFLNNVNQVLVGDVDADITFNNNFNFVDITVPTMTPGTYKVKVIKNGLEDESDEDLTVVPAHTITSFPQVVDLGETIQINGTNLDSPIPTTVTINGAPASVISNTGSVLTVTVPASMVNRGQGKVEILRAGLTVTSADDLFIRHTITTDFTTTNYVVGQSMTISGTNFRFPNANAVTVNGVNATITSLNEGSVTVTVPDAVGTGKVVVTKPTVGAVESNTDITIVPRATLVAVSPLIQQIGETITLTGTHFTAPDVTQVTINGRSATFTINSANEITATLPTNLNIYPNFNWQSFIQGAVTLTRAGLTESTPANTFTVKQTITSISPTTIARGGKLTVNGTFFINPTAAITLVDDVEGEIAITAGVHQLTTAFNQIRFDIPESATVGENSVKLQRINETDGVVTSAPFTVIEAHTITALSTDRAARGGEVVITGTNFDNSPQVYVNGTLAGSFVVDSETQITLTVPENVSGNTATIMIRRAGLDVSTFEGTSDNVFVYTIPTVTTDVSSANYVLGQTLDLSGSNFSGVNSVEIDDKAVQTTVISDNLLRLVLTSLNAGTPLSAGEFSLKLIKTAPDPNLELVLAEQITLVNQATITGIVEENAPFGTTITITGTNFTNPDVTSVSINNVNVGGNFSILNNETITATVPQNSLPFGDVNNISITRGNLTILGSDPFTVTHRITDFLRADNSTAINTNTERVVEGETIYIVGNHFESLASITSLTINGVTATPNLITGTNGSRLRVVIPDNAAGVGKVVIERRGITVESAKALVISPKTQINEIVPAARIAGGIVTVNGSGFSLPNVSSVSVNGSNAPFSLINSASMKVTIPAGANATGILSVTRNDITTEGPSFAVIPRIFSFTNAALEGSTITINGSHFGNNAASNEVLFTSTEGLTLAATITSANANTLQVVVPEGVVTGPIRITNTASGQSATSSANFNPLTPPSELELSPTNGPTGAQFFITGNHLNGVNEVSINGINATTFAVDPDGTNTQVTVPNAATSGIVSVKKSGLSYDVGTFAVTPRIINFPATAVVGGEITIVGRTFLGATSVTVNGNAATIVGTPTATQITVALTEENEGLGKIVVTTPSGSGESVDDIHVQRSPVLAKFEPNTGATGDVITLTGERLDALTAVRFNGVNANFSIISETEIAATVPENPGIGKIAIVVGTFVTESEDDFNYIKSENEPPAILATVASITGNNFTATITPDKIGTLYAVAVPTGTATPSPTQVRTAALGGTPVTTQAGTGTGNANIAFVGNNLNGVGGFIVGALYDIHFVIEDNASNLSQVATAFEIEAEEQLDPLLELEGVAVATGLTFNNVNANNLPTQTYNVVGEFLQGGVSVDAIGQAGQPNRFEVSLDGTTYAQSVFFPQGENVNATVFVRPITLANNGRSYTGSIRHSSAGVEDIVLPITINELNQASVIAVNSPEQDLVFNASGTFEVAWTTTNMVENEPLQIALVRPEQQDLVLQSTTNGTTNYTYTIGDLPSGNYAVKITAPQLPTPVRDSLRFEVDITPPVVTVTPLETRFTSPALSGTVDDPQATVVISIQGRNGTYDATVQGNNWTLPQGTIQPPLADGGYNVVATATDPVENTASDETTNELTIITVPVAVSAVDVASFSFVARWERMPNVSSYFLDVSTSPSFTSFLPGYEGRATADTFALLDEGLYHRNRYYYRVRANFGNDQLSANSNVIALQLPESPTLAADSAALHRLYIATDGENWQNKQGWTTDRVDRWEGVSFSNNRITEVDLSSNGLKGDASMVSLSNLSALEAFNLSGNELTGVPDLGALQSIVAQADISQNRLDFASFQRQTAIQKIDFSDQKPLLEAIEVVLEENQAYTIDRNIGGEGNVYQWYKNEVLIEGLTEGTLLLDDVQFEDEGRYYAEVTNPEFGEDVVLVTTEVQIFISSLERDRKALEALYEMTNGTEWQGVTGWLSASLVDWTGVTLENNRVTEVRLPEVGIVGAVPAEFTTMTSIRVIDFSGNQISGLPDFSRAGQLETLDLSRNALQFDAILKNLHIEGFDFSDQGPITVRVEERVREGLDYTLSIDVDGEDLSYQWYFNGEPIEDANETVYVINGIDYETMGDYRCDVQNATVSAVVPGFALSTGDFEILAIADIGGTVRNLANQPLPLGDAVLYRVRPIGNPFDSIGSTPIVNGRYNFEGVVLGDYIVRMFGDREVYFPTYHRAAATWSLADTIQRRRNDNEQYNAFIFFNPPPLFPGPDNRNEVIGIVEMDDEDFPEYFEQREGERSMLRRRVSRVGVAFSRARSVIRSEEEDVYELIAYVETDENGTFVQPNLPNGSYRVVVEFPGIPMDPNSFVEFELGADPTADGEKIAVEAQITPQGIVVTKIETTAIRDAYFKELNVYPNPAKHYLNISYARLNETGLQWQIINMQGRTMMQGDVPAGFDQELTLDVGHLSNGIYLLHFIDPAMKNGRQVTVVKFMVQH